MKFSTLKEKEFKIFLDKNPLKTFLQTPNIAYLRKTEGWEIYYLGVKDNKNIIIAGTMLCAKKNYFNTYQFYAPRGLLVDYKNKELLTFFVSNLKHFLKKKRGYILRIDPYYITHTKDINAVDIEGVDNKEAISNLLELGFKKSKTNEQVQYTFVLDLDKTKEELLGNMRSFTRRNIKKAIDNHIKVREISYEEIPLIKELLDSTSKRKNFSNRNLAYFQEMYKIFSKESLIKFVVAEIHPNLILKDLKIQLQEENKEIVSMIKSKSRKTKIKVHEDKILKLQEEIKEIKNLKIKYGKIINASAGIFITYGDEVVYLFGGNKQGFMKYCCAYMIQWQMINYGLDHNFKRYNFYGISGNFNRDSKDYGVYDFKKGFNGYVEELLGEYELPLNKYFYNLFNIIHTIKTRH